MNFKLVVGDDWQGLYYNNNLINEGHNFSLIDGFRIFHNLNVEDNISCGITNILIFSLYEIDQNYLENELCNFPNDFWEIDETHLTLIDNDDRYI